MVNELINRKMKNYIVTVEMQLTHSFLVEGKDERDAEEKALDLGEILSIENWYKNSDVPYLTIRETEEVEVDE